MTAKKKPAKRVRKRPTKVASALSESSGAGESPVTDARPAIPATHSSAPPNFGLLFTDLSHGEIVLSATNGYTTFRNKQDAAEWLRGFARTIETSWPTV